MSFGLENITSRIHDTTPKGQEQDRQKLTKRLNATQLEDLFRRLDINNDNELDLEEFLIVIQKLDVGSKTKELDKDFLAT
jgi:Ca2+-binding EF-hand superfamily protein